MLELIAGLFVSAAAAILGWTRFLIERRDKRIAESDLRKVRSELEVVRSRSDAPFFIPSSSRESMFPREASSAWLTTYDNVLTPFRNDTPASMPAGTLVVLPIGNEGEPVRAVSFELAGKAIQHIRYTDGTNEIWGLIEYPFDPGAYGTRQIVTVQFESKEGVHRTHRYETFHGKRRLKRIDPPLPGNV